MSLTTPKKLAKLLVDLFGGEALLPLMPFSALFPEQTDWSEYHLSLPEDLPPAIAGKTFKIHDLYCQVPACNCHKVSLAFADEEGRAWATISYGWRSVAFYRQWGLSAEDTKALRKGFLDPHAPQSAWNSYFLLYFKEFYKKDPQFIEYLKKRYAYVKENLPDPFTRDGAPQNPPANATPFNKGPRLS